MLPWMGMGMEMWKLDAVGSFSIHSAIETNTGFKPGGSHLSRDKAAKRMI